MMQEVESGESGQVIMLAQEKAFRLPARQMYE
jgi:hypothetical protein